MQLKTLNQSVSSPISFKVLRDDVFVFFTMPSPYNPSPKTCGHNKWQNSAEVHLFKLVIFQNQQQFTGSQQRAHTTQN